jgi:hypothetical protein
VKGDVQPLGQLAEGLRRPPQLLVFHAQSRQLFFVPPYLVFQGTHFLTHSDLPMDPSPPTAAAFGIRTGR